MIHPKTLLKENRMLPLICPVRHCSQPLSREAIRLTCPQGHSFDRAKSGYFNLLQPQDSRALEPGDSKSSVSARRRALDAATGVRLLESLTELVSEMPISRGAALLDVGCGEGFFTSNLASRFTFDACGLDISTAAIDAAAKRYATQQWLVVNGDRKLPFPDQSVELLTSITSCKQPGEFRRVLSASGRLMLVVSAPDDLRELREAVHGKVIDTERMARMLEIFGDHFLLERHARSTATMRLSSETLHDLLSLTYRGARKNDQERVAGLSAMDVTISYEILVMIPRSPQ